MKKRCRCGKEFEDNSAGWHKRSCDDCVAKVRDIDGWARMKMKVTCWYCKGDHLTWNCPTKREKR